MEDYLQLVNHEYQRWQEDKEQAWAAQPQRPPPFSVSQLSLIEIRCATPRCTFYVSVDTQPHCHECFEKRQATVGGGARIEGVVQTKGGGVQGGVGVTGGSETEVSSRGVRSSSPQSSSSGRGVVLSSPRSAPPTAPSLSLYSETHAMKCKTPGCLFTLSVEHDGLCERCFNSRQNHGPPGAGTAASGLPGPNGGAIVPHSAQSSGWAQWGGRETETERCSMCRQDVIRIFNGLCPPCMQRQQAPERGEPQQNNPRTEASSSVWSQTRDTAWQTPLARPCKRSGCQFFGTPEKLGFCTICYVDYQTNHRKSWNWTGKTSVMSNTLVCLVGYGIIAHVVCSRPNPSPCCGPEPAWFGGRLPKHITVSWAWVWCGWEVNARGLLRQMLRQRTKRTAQPSGTSHATLSSSSHGRGLSQILDCHYFLNSCITLLVSICLTDWPFSHFCLLPLSL